MLFCKPFSDQIFYSVEIPEPAGTLAFRSLQLPGDVDMISDWANQAYSKRFWQLDGTKCLVLNTYQALLANPNAHSFIGLFNDEPVGQVDIYSVHADELHKHVDANPNDCGLHLLMMPPKQLQKGLTLQVLQSFLDFYFSFPEAAIMYAEPDADNALANKLARDTGFRFIKPVDLSYKTANLYSITRNDLYAKNKIA